MLADWPLNKVIFVYSGSRNDSMQLNHYGGMNVYTRRRLFEYVAFLVPTLMHEINAVAASYYLGQNPQFMLLHDTMLVGGKFTALSRPLFKRAIDEQCDVLWLSPWGQANICIFSSHASAHIHDVFRYNMTMDKDTATKMEMSGVAGVDHPYSIKHLKALRQCRVGELSYETGSKKVYSAIQRISVYFPAADLVKFYVDTLRSGAVHPNQP